MKQTKYIQVTISINIFSNDFTFFINSFLFNATDIKEQSYIIDCIDNESINRIISLTMPQIIMIDPDVYYYQTTEFIQTLKTKYKIEKKIKICCLNFVPPSENNKILKSNTELYKELTQLDFTNNFTIDDFKKYIESRINIEKDIIDNCTQNKLNKIIQENLSLNNYFTFFEKECVFN